MNHKYCTRNACEDSRLIDKCTCCFDCDLIGQCEANKCVIRTKDNYMECPYIGKRINEGDTTMNKINDLPKVGVFFGKMIPPHRGHLTAIINAATRCQKLYVVVSDNKYITEEICRESGIKNIPVELRIQWLCQELQDLEHIKVVALDETHIPAYPNGWDEWCELMKKAVKEDIDAFFCGEEDYCKELKEHFPEAEVILFDPRRNTYNISATTIRSNPQKHWDHILGPARPFFAKRVLIAGTESCVDCDTEFFDGTKWKKISEYKEGDLVLQFNSDYTANLVYPLRYIKSKADTLYKLQNTFGNWSQVYSDDHDIVYITSKGNLAKKPFKEVMKKHFSNKYGFQGKLLNWFNFDGEYSIDEFRLRLMVAVSADGTKSKNKWRIRLKKESKIERMRYLITQAGLEIDERIYKDGYSNFYLPIEYGVKIFPLNFTSLTKECKEIFLNEIMYWDANIKEKVYYSTIKENVDIVQFIASSVGIKINIYKDVREDRTTCYKVSFSSVKYTTIDINSTNEKDRNNMITEYKTKDGYKYCFTVPSGMLVLRRDNHIFITGNCGKTTMVKYLAKLYNTSWSEEVGRYYASKFLGGNEEIFTDEDFTRIAYQQIEQDYAALRSCNRICFFDTDPTVTQYYSTLYMGHKNLEVESAINPTKYDVVILLKPDVEWVDDGQRLNGDQQKREDLHNRLKYMYLERGFKNVIEVSGDYNERLIAITSIVDSLIEGNK